MRRRIVILLYLICLCGCDYKILKSPGSSNTSLASDTLPGDRTIDWSLMRDSVLTSCMSCHSGTKPPQLSSRALVVGSIDKIWNEASSGAMPPAESGSPKLSPCRIAVLKKWMEMGEPESSTVRVATVPECPQNSPRELPISQMPINYQTLLTRVLQPRCLGCHNPKDNTDAGVILFYPYQELMNGAHRWLAPATESKVIQLLTSSDPEKVMPPPESGSVLGQDYIQFVERWIDAGKPEF